MFQLDDKFLQEIGLNDLPEEQKKPFLQYIYDELELRVGTRLSDGLSDDQLEEFESIIDHKDDVIIEWLKQNSPEYYNDSTFIQLQEATMMDVNDASLRAEYAATKWLEISRPDYKNIVSQVLDDLKQEVISNREVILNNDKV